jgi:membrane dipeptidase
VATHCNCRALCDVPRNLPDEDIREIASLGGVVGLTFVPDFLGPGADLDTVADHVLHAVEVAGVESVGFGSDFDGVASLPAGMEGCESWPALFDRLEARGMRGVDLNRIAGSNWRRVFNIMRGQP